MNKYILLVVISAISMTSASAQLLSPQAVEAYWGNQLKVVKTLVDTGEHPNPAIKARYHTLRTMIQKRYGKDVFVAITSNSPVKNAVAGCIVDASGPRLGIFTPTLMEIERELSVHESLRWQEKFINTVLVGLLHEMDHLASGYVLTPTDTDLTLAGRVRREKQAWAWTCEYTIEPLLKSGAALCYSDMIRYDAWIKAGRNVDSPIWEASVRGIHQGVQ